MRAIGDGNLLLTSNLVSHSLGLDNSDVINDSLVEVEILGQSTIISVVRSYVKDVDLLSVVLLDDGSGSSLDSLGSNSTHFIVFFKMISYIIMQN